MRLLTSLLLISVLAFGYQEFSRSFSSEFPAPQNSLELTEYDNDLERLKPVQHYAAISQQPLFDETRKPPVVVVQPKVVKKKPLVRQLRIQALGIAVTSENVLAVVKDLRDGKIRRLRIDDTIDGWALKGVSEDSFVFNRNGSEKVVKFKNK